MKKLAKSALSLTLCLMLVLTALSPAAGIVTVSAANSGTCGDNLTWTLDDEGTLTISGTGAMTDCDYSSDVPWYSYRSSIKNAVIESGVTSIGKYAFCWCDELTSIEIPEGVTSIGDDAFWYCTGLESVTIEKNVASIGTEAFYGCDGLTDVYYIGTAADKAEIEIGNYNECLTDAEWHCITESGTCGENLTWTLDEEGTLTISGTGAMTEFANCFGAPWYSSGSSIKKVIIESGVTSVSSWAFYNCRNIAQAQIPEGVTSIGEGAFNFCKGLTSIEIPASVTSIGEYAFNDCTALEAVTLGSGLKTIASNAFAGCTSLTGIVIPEGVTGIGENAFSGCTGITSIAIPDSVTALGPSAFWGCAGLKSVKLSSSLTEINSYVFRNCTSLTSIEIPEGVTSIGYGVFHSCTALTGIVIPASVTSFGNGTFTGCTALNDIYYGGTAEGKAEITIGKDNELLTEAEWHYGYNPEYPDTCGVCGEKLTWVLDDEGTLTISGTGDMYDYFIYSNNTPWYSYRDSIKNVIIEDGVTSIGDYAFYWCTGITSIEIPEGVTSIGWWAFCCCKGLTSIEIPDSVKSIDYGAFYACTGLTSIEIPEGVTNIGCDAFYGCTGLESIEISEGVTSIGGGAFYGCTELESVVIPASVTSIGNDAFAYCSSLESIEIPEGVTSIGEWAFGWCALTNIEIPASVTSIGEGAFGYCESLESIIVDEENTAYDSRNGCNAIIETESGILLSGCNNTGIPEGVTSIGDWAFYGCTGLKSIEIPEGVTSIGDWAFYGCTGLKSIEIPDSVTSIVIRAFEECEALTDVYYGGTEADKAEIEIGNGNEPLTDATWHYANENAVIHVAGETKLDYRTKVTITATATDVDEGFHLVMLVNGKTYTGNRETVTSEEFELKSDTSYTVKVVKDGTNEEQTGLTKTGTVKCNGGFFRMLIAFFKGLFGSLPSEPVKPESK